MNHDRAASGPDGSGGPHAFVSDLARPELDAPDRHHLARVLRLRSGDPMTVSDGAGSWRPCVFGDDLEPVGEIVFVPPSTPRIGVGFALIKGGRPELVVQKLTELGVDQIVPFAAARSVVRWDAAKAEANHVRLARVAREASMQSRRCYLPTVEPLATLGDLVQRPGAALADRDGATLTLDNPLVLIGPEGGWTPGEREGHATVRLGAQVLRAETAAIAAGTLLGALRSGLIRPGRGSV